MTRCRVKLPTNTGWGSRQVKLGYLESKPGQDSPHTRTSGTHRMCFRVQCPTVWDSRPKRSSDAPPHPSKSRQPQEQVGGNGFSAPEPWPPEQGSFTASLPSPEASIAPKRRRQQQEKIGSGLYLITTAPGTDSIKTQQSTLREDPTRRLPCKQGKKTGVNLVWIWLIISP